MHNRFYFEAITNDNEIIRPVIRATDRNHAEQKLGTFNIREVIDFDTKPLRRVHERTMTGISTNSLVY